MDVPSLRTDEEMTDIYNKYVDTVYRIALMMTKNVADAEDITQTIFIKLMTGRESFNNEEHMKAWLIRCARNSSIDFLKSSWQANKIHFDSLENAVAAHESSGIDIWDDLLLLEAKYRIPMYLHFFEGYKLREIAKILCINVATVGTRIHNGKQKLKEIIENKEAFVNERLT